MYSLDLERGRVHPSRFVESPNFDQRPPDQSIDLLVIHGISLPPAEFGGPHIDALFSNSLNPDEHPYFQGIADLRVSSHLLIRRDGELVQYVPLHLRAWHAGVSVFEGRERCNDFAVGIELEGTDEIPYTDAQYAALEGVCEVLIRSYPGLREDRVVGHCDIAPGRKTDPGMSFDWSRFRQGLGAKLAQ